MEMRKITVNEVRLSYVDTGTGPIVLLLHGFPLDHSMWRHQIEALSQRHRVLAPDLRGFGQSEGQDDKVTMRQFADDLAGLLDSLGILEPITLCGLSMGGYIAWQFWRHHGARLTGLIVCNSRAAADSAEAAAERLRLADSVLTEGSAAIADAMLPKLFAPSTLESQSSIVEATRRVMAAIRPTTIAAALRGMAERPDMTDELAGIDIPTLLVGGEFDVLTPADEMRAIARALPDATFCPIADAGHMAPLEQPARVNRCLLDFLSTRV